ncbi:conserved hypothetical protein [Myxococcus xanthus DK 1622]|uniref:Uncharacterized protein n=3 Tax=Myxococcus TaxID=32 RepID=Q1CYU6_MYXXD|nr:conserved hypothetical protein [Myxococcus xanthus DK 1622]
MPKNRPRTRCNTSPCVDTLACRPYHSLQALTPIKKSAGPRLTWGQPLNWRILMAAKKKTAAKSATKKAAKTAKATKAAKSAKKTTARKTAGKTATKKAAAKKTTRKAAKKAPARKRTTKAKTVAAPVTPES